jgi:predicted alpha/beta-fold hydrolase
MIKSATLAGFKCVVVNFRGAAGVPLTSGKIYWMNIWQDIKEPVDYIHQRYPKSRLYAYGVSLGASMLVNYL